MFANRSRQRVQKTQEERLDQLIVVLHSDICDTEILQTVNSIKFPQFVVMEILS